jgi:Apea-like HEPN
MSKCDFYSDQVDLRELLSIFLSFFGHGEELPGGAQRFQTQGSADYLDVRFTKKGKVAGLQPSPGFSRARLQELQDEVRRTLIDPATISVGQCVGFSVGDVEGAFRYRDAFQLFPVPPNAPRHPNAFHTKPFLLQFTYRASPDHMVDAYRKARHALKYTRLLNLLCGRISLGPRYTQFTWVLKPIDDANALSSDCMQGGYAYPGLQGKVDAFTDVSSFRSIDRIPFQQYYGNLDARRSNVLALPDNVEASLDRALALMPNDWTRFYRACSWFYSSPFTWQECSSSALIALVTAIECMLETKPETCPSCHQPKYGITRSFSDFLRKYFPSIDSFPREKKLLYRVRSELAHGVRMLEQDLEPLWSLTSTHSEERSLQWNAQLIVQVALYNWLWAPAARDSEASGFPWH